MDRAKEAARSRRRSGNATVMANGCDVAPGRATARKARGPSMRRTVSSTGSHRPRVSGSGDAGERTRPGSRRESFHQAADESSSSGDLTAYYAFSRRKSSVIHEDAAGLSGFLEYRKLDGSWRPFLFQTSDYQLVIYRVHPTHQVTVMSTDIRTATEIELLYEDADASIEHNETRLLKLGINGTVITLRAVSHHAAVYWVEGLQQLRDGKPLIIIGDRPTIESEEDIFRQIDHLTGLREWTSPPLPAPNAPFCGLCLPLAPPVQCCQEETVRKKI